MEATAQQMHLLPPTTDLFPHDAVRKGQGQFLENARSCMSNRIHLLAHAPTGLGKTAVSLSAALETTLENDGFIFFLTSRQSQHSVAIETLKRIWRKRQIACIDLIAREDMCLSRRSGHTPCVEGEDCYFLKGEAREAAERLLRSPLHVHESIRLCLKAGACPYMAAMAALKEADVAVCDYNQVFGKPEFSLLDRTERSPEETVLIVDEGHNLPSRIMRNNTGVLSEMLLDTALSSARLRHFSEELRVMKAALLDLASNRNDKVHLRARDLDERLRSECGVDASGLAEEMIEKMDDRDATGIRRPSPSPAGCCWRSEASPLGTRPGHRRRMRRSPAGSPRFAAQRPATPLSSFPHTSSCRRRWTTWRTWSYRSA